MSGKECGEESEVCAAWPQHTASRFVSFLARQSAHGQQTEFLSMPSFFAIASMSYVMPGDRV